MQQKISFNIIIDRLVATNGCSRNIAENFLKELFLHVIPELLQQRNNVSIRGIGVFKKSTIDDDTILYEPDKALLEVLNQPFSCFEPIELDEFVTQDIFNDEILLNEENAQDDSVDDVASNVDIDTEKLEVDSDVEIDSPVLTQDALMQDNQEELNASSEYQIVNISENIPISGDYDSVAQPNIANENQFNIDESKTKRNKSIIYLGIFVFGLILGFAIGYVVKDVIVNKKIDQYFQPQIHIDTVPELIQPIHSIDTVNTTQQVENNKESDLSPISNINADVDSTITDEITKSRFLTTMARQYYGNLHFWVYIYEENKSKLGHPDKITPGTVVVIPPKSKYNIDPLNEEAINIAKAKSKEIYAKFRKKD